MSKRVINYARRERSDAPVEIKIPQRMVNLPVIPSTVFRKIALLVLSVMALAAGWFYLSF